VAEERKKEKGRETGAKQIKEGENIHLAYV
jgi:hypothetical protein